MSKGIRITKESKSIATAKEEDFAVDTLRESGFKIIAKYTIFGPKMTLNADRFICEWEVAHKLGFAPATLAYETIAGGNTAMVYSGQMLAYPVAAVQATSTHVKVSAPDYVKTEPNYKIVLTIFGERVDQ